VGNCSHAGLRLLFESKVVAALDGLTMGGAGHACGSPAQHPPNPPTVLLKNPAGFCRTDLWAAEQFLFLPSKAAGAFCFAVRLCLLFEWHVVPMLF
jgi:hypothetical protein